MTRHHALLMAISALLASGAVSAASESSLVTKGTDNKLVINAEVVGTTPAKDLLGTHSLWWGHAEGLFVRETERTDPVVVGLLKDLGGVVRFGGGANEISWRACTGPMDRRPMVKAVPWSGPMKCRFGYDEYLQVTKDAGLPSTWMIANLAGIDHNPMPQAEMAAEAGLAAAYVAVRAPASARYWELGNELERGKYQWAPEAIAQRAEAAGRAILAKDPAARLVLPLIEYDHPAQPPRRKFNEQLLQATGAKLTGVALHLYYDGRPGGPAVSTQLNTVRETAALIASKANGPRQVWITEHGRWPEGDGSNPDWKRQWPQTNDAGGVVSSADFIIGLSQIDSVAGAMLHGLRAGPWNVFDVGVGGPKLTGVGKLLQLFGESGARERLRAVTTSRNDSSYAGGYDVRASAFRGKANDELVVWAVNRGAMQAPLTIEVTASAKLADIRGSASALLCEKISGTCTGPDFIVTQLAEPKLDASKKQALVQLPARSVTVFKFKVQM